MNDLVEIYEKGKKLAIREIKKALKKAGIDTSFVDNLEKKIKGLRASIQKELEKPIHEIERSVKSIERELKEPLTKAVNATTASVPKLNNAFEEVEKHIPPYLAAAKKIGIEPD